MSEIMYQRREDVLFSGLGEDVVALNLERGQCYGMEKVSAAVWGLIATPMNLDQICDALLSLYDIDRTQCRNEVSCLLGQLQREQLINVSGERK